MADGVRQVVGGVQIGPSPMEAGEERVKRIRGKDGDGVKRARTCKRCRAWGEVEQGKRCKGGSRVGRTKCEFFHTEPAEEEEVGEEAEY